MKKKAIVLLAIVFCISGLVSGCKKRPAEKITIGVASQVLSAPVIIAIEKGFFKDEALDVTVKEYGFGRLCLEAMFAGEVHLATVAQMPVVLNSFKRDDFSVIASFSHNYDDSKIIIRKDRGIKTGADLKNKTIGTPFGTSAHFFISVYLNYHHLDISDVKLVNMPAKDLPSAIRDGRVDAISVFEPYAYEAATFLQDGATRLPKIEMFREMFNLVSMRAYSQKHTQALKGVLKAVDRASEYIRLNKDESMAIIAGKLKADINFIKTAWDGYSFGLSLDQALIIIMEDQARWAIKNRLTDKKDIPNYLKFINQDVLREIKPEAVTIIR